MVESGIFYGTLIDPLLKPLRRKVTTAVGSNKKVIDVACGTGAQVFELSRFSSRVVGVDLSESMIRYAIKFKKNGNADNTDFFVCDATDLSMFKPESFDVAIMSLALHQFAPELHTPILNEMKKVASKIIIVDYAVPLPKNYTGFGSRVAEFMAGIEHNRNFKSYCKLGGLNKILPENGLIIQKSVFIAKGAFQVTTAEIAN